jgi:L-ribulose-5-phosphate 3-epimerase
MKKGISYWAFAPESDGKPIDPLKAMRRAKELGFECFELTVEPEGVISLKTTKEDAIRVRKEADALGMELRTLASGIAWGQSPTDPDTRVRSQAVASYARMLEICSWLGVHTLLYLPGMVSAVFVPQLPPQPYRKVDQLAKEAIRALLPSAEKHNVHLAVENVWNRFLLSPVEMRDFIDSFGSRYVSSYFDVGNVMLYGHPEDWINTLGKRITAVHMKDFRVNVGNLNGFVDLLSGDVDFHRVMQAFRDIAYSGPYTAEIVPGVIGAPEKAIAALNVIETL